MKKLFTFFCLAATVCTLQAQTSNLRPVDRNSLAPLKVAPPVIKKQFTGNNQRAATVNLALDYDGVDETYSTNNGYDYQRYIWDLNRHYGNAATYTMKYAAAFFDTLLYVDQVTGGLSFFPYDSATLTLDSFDILFIHQNTSGTQDTLSFTVFDPKQKAVSGYGTPNAVFTTPSLWDTTIYTSTTIPLNSQQFTIATFYPNLALAQGQSFGIRVDYAGDTADHFQILMGYRDECLGSCGAEFSVAGNSLAYYLNLTTPTGTNLSGYFENMGAGGGVFLDCDGSGGYTPGACENLYMQNLVVIPYVTASINYGVAIVADSLNGCPNAQLNLSANAFGSTATPFSYAWATSSGNLTSTSDQQVSLILGNSDATVTVTVTDANGSSTTSSTLVKSRGINVSITNNNPLEIACGGSATTVYTSISGVTAGKYYSWSTGATGTTQASIQVSTPGNYSVTVTNNSGCSATASLAVQYPNGIANNVTFGPIPNPVCQGKEFTLPNNSSNKNGWSATWDFGDSNLGFSLDGTHTYTNPGVYSIKLSMDSSGCVFQSSPQSVTVLAASNSACVTGIEDVTFNNAVSILPNPSKGNVTITVNAVETNVNIRVYNILGSQVMNYTSAEGGHTFTKTFDMSNLSNGTYLVKISSGNNVAVKRLVVTK